MSTTKPEAPQSQVRFICNICGVRSPQPILCTNNICPTETLVRGAASARKH